MQSNKRNKNGLKIFISILAILVIGVLGYVYSIYANVKDTMDTAYTPVEVETFRTTNTGTEADPSETADEESGADVRVLTPSELLEAGEPVSILLLGVDTGDLGRTEQGRSDSMVVVTINPHTQKTTLLSIPRDTYTEIVGYGTSDKINHAYALGGTAMSINTVQQMLDIPIDFYVMVNMAGIQEIVDAIGGITVESPLAFNQNGYDFVEGTNQLDGEAALAFARMRYEDPAGDTGRQGRQRQVIEGVIRKLATPETLLNYQAVLESLSANMQTSFQLSDFYTLQNQDYLGAVGNIEQQQLGGAGDMMNDIYYNFVDEAELTRVHDLLQIELELE
ncbi:LCP family protein [Trichococcus shcherbakoviae]|uniref:Transcriptional regulator n=1 Tax=Trichococcus shcherbakoviae subsp. psychrophilus TaxID=2585775 RepID=A0A5C5E6X1_9LACT|nr:LCP family protein [Trichococcus shcherbakoviae]TNV68517.1 transcriptional regulator [Trichococcus shcherbakoviae subsp. psychrophilus]